MALKFIYIALLDFIRQWHIRPLRNNLELFTNSIKSIFTENSEYLYKQRHKINLDFLKSIIQLPNNVELEQEIENYRIWVLWWQGEEQMPEIVRATYNSIKDATDKEVILITKDNWREYIEAPTYIEEKRIKGIISLPAFSDFIRASLLYEYGGMWIDSTILCTKEIPEFVFSKDFFSIKNVETITKKYVANGRWNVQILATNKKHCELFRYMQYIFKEYWKRYNYIMDYLLIDYTIAYIYNEKESVREKIDALPCTNPHMHELREIINDKLDLSLLSNWNMDTFFYKMTYKNSFTILKDNSPTFYKYIIERWK